MTRVVVIGAGIVGVSSALWLRRSGVDVTLIDRDDPGQGTSFGNGGVLAACGVAPVTAPGMILKSPKMLYHESVKDRHPDKKRCQDLNHQHSQKSPR